MFSPQMQATIDRLREVRRRVGPATSTPGGCDELVRVMESMSGLRQRANTVLLGDDE